MVMEVLLGNMVPPNIHGNGVLLGNMVLPNIHGNGGIARRHGPTKYICKQNKFKEQFWEKLVS